MLCDTRRMRIGLISDTHLEDPADDLDPSVGRAFAGVDLILHLGDIYATFVLDRLEAIAPVIGIRAYPDPEDPRLEKQRVETLDGLRVAMIHNLGFPETEIDVDRDLTFPAGRSVQQVLTKRFGEPVDVVVFGDTHEEIAAMREGVLLVNPGSPTYPGIRHPLGSLGTVAILELSEGRASAEIVRLVDV